MALYAISDLHLPLGVDKPMDIFGKKWENYVERLYENWQEIVKADDVVVLPGDFSWAMYLKDSEADFSFLNRLNGTKILLKGNHDYWWETKSKLNRFIAEHQYENIHFLQNNFFCYGKVALCGTRGWANPNTQGSGSEDEKIYQRELLRLEMSMQEAKKAGAEEMIVFLHFPPVVSGDTDNPMVRLMQSYGVRQCVFGHIHAAGIAHALTGEISGIRFRLVSGDSVNFTPVLLSNTDEILTIY